MPISLIICVKNPINICLNHCCYNQWNGTSNLQLFWNETIKNAFRFTHKHTFKRWNTKQWYNLRERNNAWAFEIKFKNTNWIQQMAHINQVLFKVNFKFKVKTCVSWVNSFMYNRFYTSNKPPIPKLLGNYICDPNFCETLLRSSSVILNPILFLHIDVLGRVEKRQSNHRRVVGYSIISSEMHDWAQFPLIA